MSQPTLHDVIIIGAGPCGLAVAARLCEHTPSAIFTDEEHQRYHWIRKHGRKMSIMKGKGGGCVVPARPPSGGPTHRPQGETAAGGPAVPAAVESAPPGVTSTPYGRDGAPRALGHGYKTLVLDATADQWMASWNRLFKLFDITHLRSPMFFHVDPRDRDGLLAYTYERGRKGELREIKDCVGKEISKHRRKKRQAERMGKEKGNGPKAKLEIDERERKDYYVPSRSLFSNHCECVVSRYGLNEGLVRKEAVKDIDFGVVPLVSEMDDVFTVITDKGVHYARAVVAAVGAGNAPAIPEGVRSGDPEGEEEGVCHSNQIREFPPAMLKEKIDSGKRTDVLVVGGGLTSAQLTDLAIRRGVMKVWHIMRGDVKVRPFDVNLEWMGKFKNHEKAVFWSADSDKDRLHQIRTARNGGSMTPTHHKILKSHIATGRAAVCTHATIASRTWDPALRAWSVSTSPPIPGLPPRIDYIFFATGVAPDFAALPMLRTVRRKFPLHGHGGFPCLSEDLMWRGTADRGGDKGRSKDRDGQQQRVPLFITGRLASLRLGPGAGNLEGARVGAERIAWALQEILAGEPPSRSGSGRDEERREGPDGRGEADESMYRYCAGIGSRYESLGQVQAGNEED